MVERRSKESGYPFLKLEASTGIYELSINRYKILGRGIKCKKHRLGKAI